MQIEDLGIMPYRQAWARQEAVHQQVLDGAEERLLLVEHPPVITLGRRGMIDKHMLASPEALERLGVELVQSDRGGDVTFHGPGQIVAYPIVRLNDHALSVGECDVHALEQIVIDTLAEFGIVAQKDSCAVGVWADDGTGTLAKLCAVGVRIRRGVSLHGLALNVTTGLDFFNLIVPCGLTGRRATSIRKLLGENAPAIDAVRDALGRHGLRAFGERNHPVI